MPPTLDELNGSPSPIPNPNRGSLRLGFRPATPGDLQSSPLPSPESPSPISDEDLSASVDEWADETFPESLDVDSSATTSGSPSDVEAEKVELLTEDELRQITRGGIAVAGEKAHDLFATSPGQQHVGLYLTDEKDQAQIGDPLASIAARHQGIGKKVNPDTKDFLSALVGLFSYGTKQINKRAEARALDAGAAGLAGSPQPMPQPVDL